MNYLSPVQFRSLHAKQAAFFGMIPCLAQRSVVSDFIGAGRLFFDEVGLTFYRPASPNLLHLLLKCGEQLFLSSLKLVFYGIVSGIFV